MTTIKIAVACHKPSELPHNPLYCPIQVGSALAKNRMSGMLHDDEGDNISEKNPSYCELTAQYWAWKNLDADYLGLCHYRRFLTFAEGDFKRNERNQIQAGFIDEFNIKRFGLEDEGRMREIVEQYDCVVGELEDVAGLNTPHGKQKTVYLHWAKHDRDLINVNDLDRMIQIVDERYPQLSEDMHKYLKGRFFLGYNVFVMKRELFNEMCAFEFDVLQRLEDEVDLSKYSQMRTRIYGFMAEILYSVFIYHLEKNGYKVKHLPLVYFNVTDPISKFELEPIPGAIPVVFNQVERPFDQTLLTVSVSSFLKTCESVTRYDLIVIHEGANATVIDYLKNLCAGRDNISIRFLDASNLNEGIFDRVGYLEKTDDVGTYKKSADIEALLPWILPKYDRVLSIEWNTLANTAIKKLWDEGIAQPYLIAASYDLEMLARVNRTLDVSYKRARTVLGMDDPYSFFSSAAMLLNLKAMRNENKLSDILTLYKNQRFDITVSEVYNSIYEGKVTYWNNDVVVPVLDEWCSKNILPTAPAALYRSYLTADDPVFVQYDPLLIFGTEPSVAMVAFWSIVREGPFYEFILSSVNDYKIRAFFEGKRVVRRFLDEAMPAGSDARQMLASKVGRVLSALYPDGSKRRTKIEKTWQRSWLKSRLLRYMD